MGRSAGWEQTKQGFQNFKLENQYLGAIPLTLALLAACGIWIAWKKDRIWSFEVLFWSAVAVVTLLLSFGKFFPLYKLFYMLPAISSIRNPNKFLQVFQFAIGILAAEGLDLFARHLPWTAEVAASRLRQISVVLIVLAIALLVWAFGMSTSWIKTVNQFVLDGWGDVADAIVRNRVRGAWHAALMAVAMAGMVWVLWRTAFGQRVKIRTGAVALLVIVIGLDSLALSSRYVKPMSMDMLKENDVIKFLKANTKWQRITLLSQASFYNHWLTYTFPYHNISAINVTQMPRMPVDYKAFFSQLGGNPLRLWQLFAVGFVVGPVQGWMQIQNDPALKAFFDIVYAFNVEPSGLDGFQVVPATPAQPGQHCILRFKAEAPRFSLFAGWEVAPDDAVLQKLASKDYPLFSKAFVSPDTAEDLPESKGQGLCGSVVVKSYRPGSVVLQVSADQPALLRVSEEYHMGWKAAIDGKPVPMRRCDFLFQGVFVTPGLHEVRLKYSIPNSPLAVQASGFFLCVLALGLLMIEKKPTTAAE